MIFENRECFVVVAKCGGTCSFQWQGIAFIIIKGGPAHAYRRRSNILARDPFTFVPKACGHCGSQLLSLYLFGN